MKISGGVFRGRSLRVPPGVRPTGSRLREALFSIWGARVTGARFLDLFAGSGALGLEALSRGAAAAVLVERSSRALRDLRHNCALAPAAARVLRADLPAALTGDLLAGEVFDLVVADPPYGFARWDRLLASLPALLAPDGEVAVEHSSRLEVPREAGELISIDRRVYGESALTFYARRPAGTPLTRS